MPKLARLLILGACLAGVLAAASSAMADDASVRSAIQNSTKGTEAKQEIQEALTKVKSDPKTIAKLQAGIAKLTGTMRKAASQVSEQEASTDGGKQGKADWLAGIHKAIQGFGDLNIALGDLKAKHKTAAKSEALKAATLVKEAKPLVKKGKELLGLPVKA